MVWEGGVDEGRYYNWSGRVKLMRAQRLRALRGKAPLRTPVCAPTAKRHFACASPGPPLASRPLLRATPLIPSATDGPSSPANRLFAGGTAPCHVRPRQLSVVTVTRRIHHPRGGA